MGVNEERAAHPLLLVDVIYDDPGVLFAVVLLFPFLRKTYPWYTHHPKAYVQHYCEACAYVMLTRKDFLKQTPMTSPLCV